MRTLSKDDKIVLCIFLWTVFVLSCSLNSFGVGLRFDEVFYFKSTQEMIQTGNFLSPTFLGENRFQKPILFYWLILASFKIFGVSWFAVRFVSVIFAALSVVLTWLLAKDLFDRKVATLSAVMLTTIPLFFRHAKGAVPDMAMNFFIVLAIYASFRFIQNPSHKKYSLIFFVSCALGFMIKGYAAIVVPFLTFIIYALFIGRRDVLKKINFPLGLLIMPAIILPWFLYMVHVHGDAYLRYILVYEAKNRLVSPMEGNFFLKIAYSFFNNSFFYGRALMTHFTPWSIFLIGAIPLAVMRLTKNREDRKSWGFISVWFCVVLVFFDTLFITIIHYLLVLSTPFAILISAFLLDSPNRLPVTQRLLNGSLIVLAGTVVAEMMFLQVFLAGGSFLWVPFYAVIFIIYLLSVRKFRMPLGGPLGLALLIVCVHSAQTPLLIKAGLSSHLILHRMSKIIHKDCRGNCAIAVGSYDLQEKEFQVYFDQKIEKTGTDYDRLTELLIEQFVSRTEPQLYSLVLLQDYHKYRDFYARTGFKILANDFIPRQRLSIDKGFFYAVLTLNRPMVLSYLKEEVVLLRKDVLD